MPDDIRQPEMWSVGTRAGLISCLALAVLFAGFFVLALVRHYGVQAAAFGAVGTIGMLAFARTQWLTMKAKDRDG